VRALDGGLSTGVAIGLALLVLAALTPKPAEASGVVGTGTPATCTEGALDTALTGGGSVTFNCGASPFTLTVTTVKMIAVDTTIDGGGLITLSGGGTIGLFLVSSVTLTLANVTISGGGGAGISVATGGTLTVTNCTFSGNHYSAISGQGTLTVTNSTFSGNSNPHFGGAIDIGNSQGTVTVTGCTFSGNSASNWGGAIYNGGSLLTVTNSTFSGNTAGYGAGAIGNPGGGTVTVINSTFSGNDPGAIDTGGTTVMLENTIVANNGGGNCTGGTVTDGGHNLRWPSTDPSCVGNFGDPNLAPLADNGGPTQTMALQSGSAAINAGDNAICSTGPVWSLDQRGFVRPGTGIPNCSVGAYEFDSPGLGPPTPTPTMTPTGGSGTPTPTPNRAQVNCERAVANRLAKLAVCITKCHRKKALFDSMGRPFDEEACEQGTGTPASCRTRYDRASAKLVAKGTCPTCLDVTAQGTLADSMTNFLEGELNGQIYCAGPLPGP
jgi:hypothetical protein